MKYKLGDVVKCKASANHCTSRGAVSIDTFRITVISMVVEQETFTGRELYYETDLGRIEEKDIVSKLLEEK